MSSPKHVAIIMDGNGRWAQRRLQPRLFGHRSGAKRVREVVEAAGKAGVQYLTLYAFSEENWSRPKDEVKGLFKLLSLYLKDELAHLNANNVKLISIGDRQRLPVECQDLLLKAEDSTKNNTGLVLNLALSYGARSDILASVKKIAKDVQSGLIDTDAITEDLLRENLSTSNIPDPDLLIRTSGEQRLSNFLLWELSYAELYFTEKHWPEFKEADFLAALDAFSKRDRRYGKISESPYRDQSLNSET